MLILVHHLHLVFSSNLCPSGYRLKFCWNLFKRCYQSQLQRRATGWTAGVRFPAGASGYSLLHIVQTALGPTDPPIKWATGGLFARGSVADHSPLPSTEVKNDGAIPPTLIRLHGIVLN
jgi:hypothetical protein